MQASLAGGVDWRSAAHTKTVKARTPASNSRGNVLAGSLDTLRTDLILASIAEISVAEAKWRGAHKNSRGTGELRHISGIVTLFLPISLIQNNKSQRDPSHPITFVYTAQISEIFADGLRHFAATLALILGSCIIFVL
jgi:hypothetical protein